MERPFITISTEHFKNRIEGFDIDKTMDKLHENAKKGIKHEQVILKNAYHTD